MGFPMSRISNNTESFSTEKIKIKNPKIEIEKDKMDFFFHLIYFWDFRKTITELCIIFFDKSFEHQWLKKFVFVNIEMAPRSVFRFGKFKVRGRSQEKIPGYPASLFW